MSKNKDTVEIKVYKKRDEAIECFQNILERASKTVKNVHEEFRKYVTEQKKQNENATIEYTGNLNTFIEDLNLVIEEDIDELVTKLEAFIKFLSDGLLRCENAATKLDKTSGNAKFQITQVENQTLDMIQDIWCESRDFMEKLCRDGQDIIPVKTGFIEDIDGLAEIKIREMKIPFTLLKTKLLCEQEEYIKPSKAAVADETKDLKRIKREYDAKYAIARKAKDEKDRLAAEEEAKKAEEAKKLEEARNAEGEGATVT